MVEAQRAVEVGDGDPAVVDPRGAADIAREDVCRRLAAPDELVEGQRDLATNPLVFPDAETQARLSGYHDLLPPAERQMNERYAQVTGG